MGRHCNAKIISKNFQGVFVFVRDADYAFMSLNLG